MTRGGCRVVLRIYAEKFCVFIRTKTGYSIPEGNLFASPEKERPEVYAMGTRNHPIGSNMQFPDILPLRAIHVIKAKYRMQIPGKVLQKNSSCALVFLRGLLPE